MHHTVLTFPASIVESSMWRRNIECRSSWTGWTKIYGWRVPRCGRSSTGRIKWTATIKTSYRRNETFCHSMWMFFTSFSLHMYVIWTAIFLRPKWKRTTGLQIQNLWRSINLLIKHSIHKLNLIVLCFGKLLFLMH